MIYPLPAPFKLYTIAFTLHRYSSGVCAAFIQYAHKDDDNWIVEEKEILNECNDFLFNAVKNAYSDATFQTCDIKYNTQLIALRNCIGRNAIDVTLLPNFEPISAFASLNNKNIPNFTLTVSSHHNLKDEYNNPDFDLTKIKYHVAFNNKEWDYIHTLAKFFSQHMMPVETMMEIALPGITYPLSLSDIHEGDNFYTDMKTVAKVKEIRGLSVKMSDGHDYYVTELRPLPANYLNIFSLKKEKIIEVYKAAEKSPHFYAHLIQTQVRAILPNEELPLKDTCDFVYLSLDTREIEQIEQ